MALLQIVLYEYLDVNSFATLCAFSWTYYFCWWMSVPESVNQANLEDSSFILGFKLFSYWAQER